MIIAACVDEAMGLRFNGRRQSRDKSVIQALLSLCPEGVRYAPGSAALFPEGAGFCGESYLSEAKAGDLCFVEELSYLDYPEQIEKILLFQWNRSYPGDLFFQFPGQWRLESKWDIPGNSHEIITVEVYTR